MEQIKNMLAMEYVRKRQFLEYIAAITKDSTKRELEIRRAELYFINKHIWILEEALKDIESGDATKLNSNLNKFKKSMAKYIEFRDEILAEEESKVLMS